MTAKTIVKPTDSYTPSEKRDGKIVVRLYIPKDYEKMEKKAKKEFDELRSILESAPKEWYSLGVLKDRSGEDPENTVLFFGGVWCYEIDSALEYVRRLTLYPSYRLRRATS